ncbi:hypothetical protein PCASD_21450 [Puccinia coronata f. sp. avenae]|uniref:Uncharacterized protein n=1 Tax=Puccinia coronata f. sp. avenae TaxID=200324 RepID=A0A2N5S446_9BASI|nr:hypothetical protein PCASD_21450 [Puccinia coronata f. sp. avenae]
MASAGLAKSVIVALTTPGWMGYSSMVKLPTKKPSKTFVWSTLVELPSGNPVVVLAAMQVFVSNEAETSCYNVGSANIAPPSRMEGNQSQDSRWYIMGMGFERKSFSETMLDA